MFSRKIRISSFVLLAATLACASGCATEVEAPPEAPSEALAQVQSRWDIDSDHDETKATHLFIVNRALDLLEHPDAKKNAKVEKLRAEMVQNPVCNAAWRKGLYDADYKAEFNGGKKDLTPESSDSEIAASGATWASHFYDPDTQRNYEGNSRPTAYTQQLDMRELTNEKWNKDREKSCYYLGVALHYFTDVTEPMHAANFTAVSLPVRLHSNVEHYAQAIQADQPYPLVSRPYDPARDPDDILISAAKITKPRWAALYDAIGKTYRERDYCFWDYTVYDSTACWTGAPRVKDLILRDLDEARKFTAEYIYSIGERLPQ